MAKSTFHELKDDFIDSAGDIVAGTAKHLNTIRRSVMKVIPSTMLISHLEEKVVGKNQNEKIDKLKNAATKKVKELTGSATESVAESVAEASKNAINSVKEEVETLHSINEDLDELKLYGFGKNNNLKKEEVIKTVRSLPSGYRKSFSGYLKNNDIKGLQHSLNGKIEDWEGNDELLNKYKEYLKSHGISLKNDHIDEDGKLGPQTIKTLEFVSENRNIIHGANGVIKKMKKGYQKILDKNQEKADTNNQSGKKVEKKMIKNKKRKRRRK